MRSAEDQVVEDEVGFQDDEVYIDNEENTEFTEHFSRQNIKTLC